MLQKTMLKRVHLELWLCCVVAVEEAGVHGSSYARCLWFV